ncbi:ribbon-helix-helix domain-containing protein [Aureimonas sp. AU20]|uniref:ribbon-helix-helix domain-containing protein n=1 Tax=Aureimonas sp. AU20 TaxID=1349819 RepID=UPI00071FE4D8|nr:ribbon-helix-helix domain-containing protein [Aureimonas sp. AU20]ALN75722.1 hypothetical protein M673_23527 [Aureimonas sp. AU20]
MTKRPSIASLAPKKGGVIASVEVEQQTLEGAPRSATRDQTTSYKAVLAKVDEETHRALKILSANEGTPIGDLFVESLNLLFRSRNLPEIAMKVTPDERSRAR